MRGSDRRAEGCASGFVRPARAARAFARALLLRRMPCETRQLGRALSVHLDSMRPTNSIIEQHADT
jgi:hypothetical protein